MKLYGTPRSPFARNVRVLLFEKGLHDGVEWIDVNPLIDPPELTAKNPLGLVPTLVLDDGRALFDSLVICDYIDALAEPRLIPKDGDEAIETGRLRAMTQGIMDLTVKSVLEMRRPPATMSMDALDRWKSQIERTVDVLEAEADSYAKKRDLAALSVVVALGYVDFRRPEVLWRKGRPKLAAFYDEVAVRPSLTQTAPPPA